MFKARQTQTMEKQNDEQQKIGKEPDPTNPGDLPEYI